MPAKRRCSWATTDPVYIAYHDTEWGVPQHDSRALWEMLMLEGFQAGLSWITILRKREASILGKSHDLPKLTSSIFFRTRASSAPGPR